MCGFGVLVFTFQKKKEKEKELVWDHKRRDKFLIKFKQILATKARAETWPHYKHISNFDPLFNTYN